MTSRVWAYNRLATDSALLLIIGTSVTDDQGTTDPLDDTVTVVPRVFASTRVITAPKLKPFIMYRQTSEVEGFRGDDGAHTLTTGFMIFAHDEPGDYLKIDTMIGHIRRLFADIVDQAEGIVRSRYIETSDDLRDDDMGTIMKYARIQVISRI